MILALDFDGVIWDSVGECYQMARRTWKALYGEDPPEVEASFRKGRWLARCGGDFYKILKMAIENPGRDWEAVTKAQFAAPDAELDRFQTEFYAQRERCRNADPEGWAAMQRPYPEVVAALPRLQERFAELVVCTTKDEASARALLESVGLHLHIWGREHGVDKGAQVRDLCARRAVEGTSIIFVDDLLDNLEQVRSTGARLYLAAWGYNTAAEQEEARRRGAVVIERLEQIWD